MSKKRKLIPEIRFPEFKNEGEWDLKTLEDVLDYERPDKYIVHNTNYLNEGTPVLTANKSFILGYTNEDFGIYKKLPAIIFDDFTVDSKFVNFSFKVKSSAIKILTPKKKYDLRFTYELISQIDFNATEHKRYYISEYQKLKLPFPLPKEQLKIASCLSSLDDLIEAHNQKLDLLKDHKKGLIQNFFPQEGGKMPKYRFSEFINDENWIKETVGDVYDFKVTNSFAREYLNYENGSVKNIHYGDIHTKFNTLFDISKEDVPFINPDVSIEKIRKESYCIAGDIIFADASEDMNDVGKSIEIVNLNKENLVSGLHTLLARQKEKKLAIGFGGYLFKSDWIRKQIQREAQGAKVLGISATRISNVQILYPKNHKEQQKISSCLSSLDELIKSQAEKIEKLKKHKKGLMQVLFPKMIE
ncbi:MAG: restriction endonuclease subunit S [Weeksellaceae bacterium]|nr:restriction endonuclease subunit S [Weeksellaceae bacterium]